MVSYPQAQSVIFNTFKGIRTRNGVNSDGQISATVCQNIEFVPNDVGSSIQIRTTLGNIARATFTGYNIIKIFETSQDETKHFLVYAENDDYGVLAEYDVTNKTFNNLVNRLTVTGEANGFTMVNSAYDVFVFTNGVDYYSIDFVNETNTKLNPTYNSNAVTGLAMCEQDGSLVIGSPKGYVIASRKGDITDWDYTTASDTNKPWYQLFGKGVTAVVPYIDGLLVFTPEDSTLLTGNMSTANGSRADSSLGGCMSYESWCFHDQYLFFYDDRQKNIYYYVQTDTGQKQLGKPIAPEIQKYFDGLTRMQMMSYVGNNKSEIWLLSNKFTLIFDYFVGEWTERVGNTISSYCVYDNTIYSSSGSKILEEYAGDRSIFDGVFYPSKYEMQTINLGSYSNLKEMEMQPLFTVSNNYNNKFWVVAEIDGKKTKEKLCTMYSAGAIWGDDTETFTDREAWDIQVFDSESENITHQVKGKFIPNWYYLKFTLETRTQDQDFNIKCMELKGITQETDTTGRK